MRRVRSLVALSVIVAGAVVSGAPPAGSTHCDPTNLANCPNPVAVTVFEGLGLVCGAAGPYARSCVHDMQDPLWNRVTNNPPADGLYWPTVGPAGKGPFIFSAGGLTPPTGVCVSTLGGPGCVINSHGELGAGQVARPGGTPLSGDGAYCGSSRGEGVFEFTAGDGSATFGGSFAWVQTGATIIPFTGTVTSSNPPGGAGATIVGFTSSRGVTGTGNCGITNVTTAFQVEGMSVTF